MKTKFKKLLAITMAVTTLFAFASNSSAYSKHVNTNSNSTYVAGSQYIGSGTYTGKIGVSSISANPSGVTPQITETLYYSGYTILSRTFTGVASATKSYTISGVTEVKCAYKNVTSNATLTADIYWYYN